MTGYSRLEVQDGIVVLTFTRDEKLNAVHPSMIDALSQALDRLEDDAEVRVLVIAAEGRHFTAGMDIAAIDLDAAGAREGSIDGVAFRRFYRKLHATFDRIEQIEKPVIASIQGPCRGVGVEFGVSCDFRICATRAMFALPEIENLAVIPGSGGISRLTRLVGPHWARWLVLAGQSVDAHQALNIGLVHEVVDDDQLRARTMELAALLASMSSEAVGLAKLTIDAAATVDRATARDVDRIANTILIGSPQHRELIDRFSGRR